MAWNGAPWPVWGCAPKTGNRIQYKHHEGEIIGEKDGFLIMHCQVCILNHVANLPSEEFLAEYYAKQFYTFSKPDYLSRYERDRVWWEMHHSYTISQASKLLQIDSTNPQITIPTVLDVGTGPGIFLDVAKKHGFRTYGVEPSAVLCGHVRNRGHQMTMGTLKDFMAEVNAAEFTPPKSLSMVNAYEVLEHVSDPEGFLDICRSLLVPGGVLSITVPNDYNLLQMEAQKKLGLKEWWLAPPEHLNYFEPKSLQLMVRRVGFKIQDIRTTFPLERFLLDGKNYIGNDTLGRQCHAERKAFEFKMRDLRMWEEYMDDCRAQCSDPCSGTIGREIVLLAIKE